MPLLDDLLDLQVPNSLHLSPNGQQVIYSTGLTWGAKHADAEHSVSSLWLAETGKAVSARALTNGESNDHAPRWSPGKGDSIAFLSDRGRSADRKESSAIFVLPVSKPGEARALTSVANEREIAKFEWRPDGMSIAFLSADEKTEERKKREKEKDDVQVWGEEMPFHRLRVVDLEGGVGEVVVGVDADVLDFAWSADGRKMAFTTTRRTDIESPYLFGTDVWVVDVKSKERRRVVHVGGQVKDLVWAGEKLYWVGPIAKGWSTSAYGVHSVDVPANVCDSKDEDESDSKSSHIAYAETNCALNLSKTSTGEEILVYVQNGMADEVRLLNGDRTLYSRKQKLQAWDACFTTDSDEVILAVATSNVNNPTEVFTTTASGGSMVKLSTHGKQLLTNDRKFGTSRFITCKSLDGTVDLECPFLLPSSTKSTEEEKPNTPLPTVVLIHGGPYYRHTEAFDGLYFLWTPLLLSKGYAVLLPDYRGSSGRGETWAAYARDPGTGKLDYADVIAQTNAAVEQGYADKDRLVVGGWSQGGFLSYLCSVRNGTHGLGWEFKASIPGAGMTELDTMALTSDVGFWEAELLSVGAPWACKANDSRNRQGSALWEFALAVKKGLRFPAMLMLHGEQDVRVPIEQARGMRRALEELNRKVEVDGREKKVEWEYVIYPREGHVISERRHLLDLGTRVAGWVEKYIGPGLE
ncbi:hypothetical protein LTR62_005269 [Meristemomyces frigidus]|uniref:Dipeptidyl-peptidase V n=1 Tax=Meristemomyces frigidus TaxID=1508187 RepID=A0AAN7YFL7_9PEZI|nr:hypothetical protein LTR62_005269 [Meristemomyces frigidus]